MDERDRKAEESFTNGLVSFKEKRFESAEEHFTESLVHDAENATVYSNRAMTRIKLGKLEEAVNDARECIRIDPGWAKGYFRLAVALHGLTETVKCYRAICFAFALEPQTQLYRDMKDSVREELGGKLENEEMDCLEKEIMQLLPNLAKKLSGLQIDKSGIVEGKGDRIPVTVLSGFLGSGKTTLMSHLLSNSQGLKVGVIVNDMSEINIDASLIRANDLTVSRKTEELVELSNGCICCTLRDDLLNEIIRLASEPGKLDYILIEGTGIAEPIPVAQTFLFEDVTGRSLSKVARLDTMVTVVDASSFLENLGSEDNLRSRNWQATQQDSRTIANLLVDQVEFANVIILNKADLVSTKQLNQTQAMLHSLNPKAEIVLSTFSNVDPSMILNTGKFCMEQASQSPGWLAELRGEHIPETEEYGIRSFAFQTLRPFDAIKFSSLVSDPEFLFSKCNVIRSKGFCWVVQDPRIVIEWATAGRQMTVGGRGFWECALRKGEHAEGHCSHGHSHGHGEVGYSPANLFSGEQSTQLIFIGVNLNIEELRAKLESCVAEEDNWQAKGNCVADVWASDHSEAAEATKRCLGSIIPLLRKYNVLSEELLPSQVASTIIAALHNNRAELSPIEEGHKEELVDNIGKAALSERLDEVRAALIALHDQNSTFTEEDLTKMATLSNEYTDLIKQLGLVDETEAVELDQNAQLLHNELSCTSTSS